MTFTRHGHHISGTDYNREERPPIARCGGPAICKICGEDLARVLTQKANELRNVNHLDKKDTTMSLEFREFVRKPFTVRAVEITKENIEEIAEIVGKLQYKPDGSPYIQVNRRFIPNVSRVYPGFWMTEMGEDNIRCYSRRAFRDQFVEMDGSIQDWVDYMNGNRDQDTVETPVVEEAKVDADNGPADAGIA